MGSANLNAICTYTHTCTYHTLTFYFSDSFLLCNAYMGKFNNERHSANYISDSICTYSKNAHTSIRIIFNPSDKQIKCIKETCYACNVVKAPHSVR